MPEQNQHSSHREAALRILHLHTDAALDEIERLFEQLEAAFDALDDVVYATDFEIGPALDRARALLASNPASSPFDGLPGTSSAAGGSWGNSGGDIAPATEASERGVDETVSRAAGSHARSEASEPPCRDCAPASEPGVRDYRDCAICGRAIVPSPRYFTDDGEPRHMLCGGSNQDRSQSDA